MLRSDVAGDHCAGTDHRVFADNHTLYDRSSCPHVYPRSDANAAAQCGARSNMNVVVHLTVMIHDGAGINYRIVADPRSRLHQCPCHDLHAVAQLNVLCYACGGVDDRPEAIAEFPVLAVDAASRVSGRVATPHRSPAAPPNRERRDHVIVAEADQIGVPDVAGLKLWIYEPQNL